MITIQFDSEQLSLIIQHEVRKVLSELPPTQSSPLPVDEKPLSVEQAAEFLNVSKQTVYQNAVKIPHRKRFGRLYFLKKELISYLEEGRSE